MRLALLTLGATLIAAPLGGCSNDPTLGGSSSTGANLQFKQIDRLGKGSIAFFSPYAQHDTLVRLAPGSDYTNLTPQITTFMTGFGRSSAVVGAAANASTTTNNDAVLVPDVLVADLTQSGDASFLGTELGGTLNVSCTTRAGAGLFGGRALTDDAGRGLLSAALGAAIPSAALAPDDGKELDGRAGTPNATNDNVACNGKNLMLQRFPYLGAPH